MSTYPPGYRIALAVGLSGAAWLSGNIAALSLIAVPALANARDEKLVPPGAVVKLWNKIYDAGKSQNPPVAAITAAAFLYLAWSVYPGSPTTYNLAGLYTAAAVLTVSIVPYTILTMRPTNNALIKLAKSRGELTATEVAQSNDLLGRWVVLNGIRSLLPLVGGVVAITAAFF